MGWTVKESVRILGVAALGVTVATGCSGRFGSMRWDAGAGRDFETAQVLDGHRYYTTGSEGAPDAILALREDRPLRSPLWREVPMTRETLARLVDRMRGTRNDGPYASVVLDDRGERIGAWLSWRQPAPVRLLDDGGVLVSPPPPPIDPLPPDGRAPK